MRNIKQINTINRADYFFNYMINVEDFDSSLLKITRNHTKILIFITLDI